MLGMIRFPSQIIQPCEAHISMQSECEAHISMQAHIAMHQVRFHIISTIYFHFTCMVPYIVCPACVCDGTAQVTLGSFRCTLHGTILDLQSRYSYFIGARAT